jgi:hypothetical protein
MNYLKKIMKKEIRLIKSQFLQDLVWGILL